MRSIIKRRQAKGQAAMEFLMTYGWAILAAIIAIGVLAYFGVFNPSRLAGSTAVINAPFNADAFNIVNDDAACTVAGNDCINMEITQNLGKSIDVSSASIVLTSGGSATCAGTATTGSFTGWTSGSGVTVAFDCTGAAIWNAGDAVAGDITITYTATGSTLAQTSTGNVRGVST